MIITAEISHYPLKDDYEANILDLINKLKSNEQLSVFTNSMSTYVKGETKIVFGALAEALETAELSSTVIKVINRNLPVESGFLDF